MVSLITIGPIDPNGTCWGMALPTDRPLSDMVDWCCGPDAKGNNTDYAAHQGARIRAMVRTHGYAAIDMSGWCCGRPILDASGIHTTTGPDGSVQQVSLPGDAAGVRYYADAIKRTVEAGGCEPEGRWVLWSNSEGGNDDARFAKFRELWDTGVTGNAMLCVTNMIGGRTPKPMFGTRPRAIDNRCSEIPGWIGGPWGNDQDCLDRVAAAIDDVRRMGLNPILHCDGVGFDGSGKRVSDERRATQTRMLREASHAGVTDFLIFNAGGNVGASDVPSAQESEAATVEAIYA